MAAEPPAKPPKEIPDILREDVEKLHRSVQVLLVSKQIPWIVQAQMARDGYTTMEDLRKTLPVDGARQTWHGHRVQPT